MSGFYESAVRTEFTTVTEDMMCQASKGCIEAHLCQAVQLQVHPSSVAAVHHLCSRLSLLSLPDICLILQLRPLPCAAICSLTRAVIAQHCHHHQQLLVFEGSALICKAARSSPMCPSWH